MRATSGREISIGALVRLAALRGDLATTDFETARVPAWHLESNIYLPCRGELRAKGSFDFLLDDDGRLLEFEGDKFEADVNSIGLGGRTLALFTFQFPDGHQLYDGEEGALFDFGSALNFIPFFAISLLHCKNVRTRGLIDNYGIPKSAKEGRHRAADNRWYELEIEWPKRLLREAGWDGSPVSLGRAFHLVRGHFAEYGPEFFHADGTPKGLRFGRDAGRFLIPMHTRGDVSAGTVSKDYKIKLSRSET